MSLSAPAVHLRPPAPPVAPTLDTREARRVTRRHAQTFSIACRVLPHAVRDDVYLLYTVFRALDDLVDEGSPEAEARVRAVAGWAEADAGAASPEVEILAALETRHAIDRGALADFCAGMLHDLRREPFATEADLDRYCYRVAGTVGIVMSGLLGADGSPAARMAAASLGMAMQRTNILRDIDEDAVAGRLYVSRESLDRFGYPVPGHRGAFMREQIARADALYARGLAGIPHLRRGGLAIASAAAMYREILRELERRDGGERPGRAVVSTRRKLWVAGRAALSRP